MGFTYSISAKCNYRIQVPIALFSLPAISIIFHPPSFDSICENNLLEF
jgi:hypothetical protein